MSARTARRTGAAINPRDRCQISASQPPQKDSPAMFGAVRPARLPSACAAKASLSATGSRLQGAARGPAPTPPRSGAPAPEALRDVDYGDWRGKSLRDLARDMPGALRTWLEDPCASPHGGDSFEDVICRVGHWLECLPHQGNIVAVTHSVVVRAAIVYAQQAEPKAMSRIDVSPLSFTEFTRSFDGWKLAVSSGKNLTAIRRN
ncbi:histidine phosphatase family protein [Burkholderia sp. MR1-5-21]